jgi:hypothetical protein
MKQKINPGGVCRRYAHTRAMYLVTILAVTLCCSLCTSTLFAQQSYRINGIAADTAAGFKLANATIYVLRAKDSTLVSFTYVAADGTFSIDRLPAGNYILLMTYPNYADYVELFALDTIHTAHHFHTIYQQSKARLLQEVIVRGKAQAIRIKGDTTEFNARSYTIQPNDKVEDLLKQLPGLQVDKNGKITANGEAVTKVLLDGEEFFGDDPTLVTRNIRADMVDKVQLYDKKSDQAAFTGIDDGVRKKTINVTLRADKNTGAFGKVEAGAGTNSIYQTQAFYNKFKPGVKYAAYGTVATNGKVSLGAGDNNRLGASGNNVLVGDAVVSMSAITDDQDGFNGTYNGKGLPLAHTGGVHYDGKWNAAKEMINANYKAGYLAVAGVNAIITERRLPDAAINSRTDRYFDNSAFRQKMDAVYQRTLDSSSGLKIAADGTLKNMQTASNHLTTTMRDGMLLNQNRQSQHSNDDAGMFNASALYTKKFRKAGHTFSWNGVISHVRDRAEAYLNSSIDFYGVGGVRDSTQRIDQYKTTVLNTTVLSSNMTFSTPVSKKLSLIINYGAGLNNTGANRKSFNQSAPGKYTQLDTAFSNEYIFDQLTNQAGSIFNYKMNKWFVNFGTKISYVNFKQANVYTGNIYRRNFINWSPQVSYQYRDAVQNVSLNYDGNRIQPGIDQVQPIRVNNDPLNIVLGNPQLQPAFINRFSFRYRSFRPLKNRSVSFAANYNFTSDAIVHNVFTDAVGRNTVQYINLRGRLPYNYMLSSVIGLTIKQADINVSIEIIVTGNRAYGYINNALSRSDANTYWASVQLQKNVQKKYSFSIVAGPNYSVNRFSLFQERNNNAAGFYGEAGGSVYLPHRFQLISGINYTYTAASRTLTALSSAIWNASLAKTFFEGDKLKLSLSANDLLNQRVNFTRSVTANAITQNNYTAITRYFMLSVTWDFSQFATQPVKK